MHRRAGGARWAGSGEDGQQTRECKLTISEVHECNTAEERDVVLELHTGRVHQIRGQMSTLGWPLVGDQLYTSDAESAPEGFIESRGLCLRAVHLAFTLGNQSYAFDVNGGDLFAFE